MHELLIETSTHGRVLVDESASGPPVGLIVAFHGYAERAEDTLDQVRQIPGAARWRIASAQGLHLFYGRGPRVTGVSRLARDARAVIASWMTREHRDTAIADNVAYVDRVVDAVSPSASLPLVFAGFSQGASMAYRAAGLGRRRADGIVALAGDIPPELESVESSRWPPVLIGAGDGDEWFAPKLAGDVVFLESRGVRVEVVRFPGGHGWSPAFREAAGAWLEQRVPKASS